MYSQVPFDGFDGVDGTFQKNFGDTTLTAQFAYGNTNPPDPGQLLLATRHQAHARR